MNDPSDNINRILALIPYIRENPGIAIQDLARQFRCGASEIVSDLNRILLCGVPPYLPDDYIGVYIENDCVEINFADHFARPIRLTIQEGLALRLALESLPPGAHPAFRKARESLLAKVTGLIRVKGVSDRVASTAGRSLFNDHLDLLGAAIPQGRKVVMEYYSQTSDEVRERTVRPYALTESRGKVYLLGHDERRARILTFRVDRIRTLRTTEQTFEFPPDFDLEAYSREKKERGFTPAEGEATTVQVSFSAESARYVREEFPADQIQAQPDGTIVLTFGVGSSTWLFRWILQYGDEAQILEPREYREEMARFLAAYLAGVRSQKSEVTRHSTV